MADFTLKMTGVRPLLMNSPTLIDSLHPTAREKDKLSSISASTRTDEQEWALRRLEWTAAMYFEEQFNGPYVPWPNVLKCMEKAGALVRRGLGVKVRRALLVKSQICPVHYRGPRDLAGLWADPAYRLVAPIRNAGRSGGRVMRTRPKFDEWGIEFDGQVMEDELNFDDLQRIAERAGWAVGLGDWRPFYGTFNATVERSG